MNEPNKIDKTGMTTADPTQTAPQQVIAPATPPDRFVGINGSNLFIQNSEGCILVGKSRRPGARWELPGGEIDRGELAPHAAVSEAEEETGVIVDENKTVLMAVLLQRIPKLHTTGNVFLFLAEEYDASSIATETEETSEVAFKSVDEIMQLHLEDKFSLASARMVVYAMDIIECRRKPGVFARLSDQLNFVLNGKPIAV